MSSRVKFLCFKSWGVESCCIDFVHWCTRVQVDQCLEVDGFQGIAFWDGYPYSIAGSDPRGRNIDFSCSFLGYCLKFYPI
jgi:hypothetical protein